MIAYSPRNSSVGQGQLPPLLWRWGNWGTEWCSAASEWQDFPTLLQSPRCSPFCRAVLWLTLGQRGAERGREGLSSLKCGVQHLVDSFQAPTSLLPLDLCSPPSGTQAPQHTVMKPRCSTCLFSPHRWVPPPPNICNAISFPMYPAHFWGVSPLPELLEPEVRVPFGSPSFLLCPCCWTKHLTHLSVLLCFTFRKSGRACHYHPSATWWRTVSENLPNPRFSVFSVGAEAS